LAKIIPWVDYQLEFVDHKLQRGERLPVVTLNLRLLSIAVIP
jgi:hypothetical protein